MARLTYRQRKALPKSAFAVPGGTKARREKNGGGSFPIPDKAHARNALARAHQRPHGPGSYADRQVHKKVKEKFPELYRQHIQRAHRGKAK